MTQHPELFAALAAPFDAVELKNRPQAGKQMPYVTARTIMNRLDEVLGPENWWDEYVPLEHSVICRMTIRLPDGTTLTKSDAGGYAGLADPGDDDKSGFADAFKRTAVKFGVGRYLYRDGVPRFSREEPKRSAQVVIPVEAIEQASAPAAGMNPPASPACCPQRQWHEHAPNRPGLVRLDQRTGWTVRIRATQAPECLGEEPGLPGPDGRLGRRAGGAGARRSSPPATWPAGHTKRNRSRAGELSSSIVGPHLVD